MAVSLVIAKATAMLFGDRADARGRERLRRVFFTSIAALVARVGTILTLLVTVPMALHHLGPERFGLWMILSSLAAMTAFADFGIGNGVLNLVAHASGQDDEQGIREATSTALLVLGGIGTLIAVIGLIAFYAVDWGAVFRLTSPLARAEAGPATLIFWLCLAVGLPLGLGAKIQIALQQGYAANLWTGAGGLLSLMLVTTAIHLDAGIPTMVLALFGSQQFVILLNYFWVFCVERPSAAPKLRYARRKLARSLFSIGMSFFVLQLISVISYRIDALLIARFFGPVEAGSYAVYERLFSFVSLAVTVVVMPLWPAYGEAFGRGDHQWVKATFRKSLIFSLSATVAASLPLVLLHGPLLRLWLGHDIPVSLLLIGGMAIWKLLDAFGQSTAALLNGLGTLRPQLIVAVLMCICATLLKFLLAPHLGIAAIVWSTVIGYGLFAAIPLWFIVRRVLGRMHSSDLISPAIN
jgi:O-antigen/teichoic acid export membrane protein